MAALPRRLHRSSTALTPVVADPDRELLAFNVRLAKQRQGLLDVQRLERKAFREHARVDNAVAAYTRETVLVVQLSDLHFNERVELPSNRYDFSVASARLAKLAARIKLPWGFSQQRPAAG